MHPRLLGPSAQPSESGRGFVRRPARLPQAPVPPAPEGPAPCADRTQQLQAVAALLWHCCRLTPVWSREPPQEPAAKVNVGHWQRAGGGCYTMTGPEQRSWSFRLHSRRRRHGAFPSRHVRVIGCTCGLSASRAKLEEDFPMTNRIVVVLPTKKRQACRSVLLVPRDGTAAATGHYIHWNSAAKLMKIDHVSVGRPATTLPRLGILPMLQKHQLTVPIG